MRKIARHFERERVRVGERERQRKKECLCLREKKCFFLLKRGKERECVGVRVRSSCQVSKRECERDREK